MAITRVRLSLTLARSLSERAKIGGQRKRPAAIKKVTTHTHTHVHCARIQAHTRHRPQVFIDPKIKRDNAAMEFEATEKMFLVHVLKFSSPVSSRFSDL